MPDVDDPHLRRLDALERAFGHRFADHALLTRALTHASRIPAGAEAAARLRDSNERLEFLGDALLGAALADHLCRLHPDADEGQLSRLKSNFASRATLARAIERLELLPLCLVGPQMGGDPQRWPDSVKANLIEALFAAVFLDGGWPALAEAVRRTLGERLTDPAAGTTDARMRLQEWCLANHHRLPDYTSERKGGSDHNPVWTATVAIGDHRADGTGVSRRRAEAVAAENLILAIATATKSG